MNATNYFLPVPAAPDAGGAGSGFDPLTGGDAGLIKKTLCDAACSGRAFGLPQWADELIDAFRQVDAEGAVL